jgi:fibronectin-binding autotransporter adhesin
MTHKAKSKFSPRLAIAIAIAAGGAAAVLIALSSAVSATTTCTIYWTGATSTNWGTTSNWSLTDGGASAGGVPTTSDYVCMSSAPKRANVVATSAARSLAGINFSKTSTVTPSLELQGNILTVNTNASTINNLAVDAGFLGGTAQVTLTGSPQFASGAGVINTGAKIIPASTTLEVGSSLLVGSPSSPAATGLLQINGTLQVDASATVYLSTATSGAGATLTNSGTMTMADGSAVQVNGGGASAPRFTSAGTLTAGSGSSTETIATQFTNTGSLQVGNEPLQIQNGNVTGTTDTGTWAVPTAPIDFQSGTRTLSAGSITGASGAKVDGSALTFGASYPVSALDLESGAVAGSPSVNGHFMQCAG